LTRDVQTKKTKKRGGVNQGLGLYTYTYLDKAQVYDSGIFEETELRLRFLCAIKGEMSVISPLSQLVAVFYLPEYNLSRGCVGSKIQGVTFSIRLDYILMGTVTRQS
jgi:hypothetical protein